MNSKIGISLALVLATVGAAGTAAAGPDSDKLRPNEALFKSQRIVSPNCRYMTQMQEDGNLVSYSVDAFGNASALWASEWAPQSIGRPFFNIFQTDGNWVVYNSNQSNFRWASGTMPHNEPQDSLFGHYGKWAIQQNDGNLVIPGVDGFILWATNFSDSTHSSPCRFPASKTRIQWNTDMPNGNMAGSPFNSSTWETCGDACAHNSSCTGWAFTGNGLCWLKNSIFLSPTPFQGVTSGLIVK